jgi:lipopolysaccharide/colanic/teichoic acid biosynthesis glycosyltransferase
LPDRRRSEILPFVKRTFDVVVSLFALTILAPVLGAIALGVLATSPGGVLFRQVRMGRANRPFNIVKFRTMSVVPDAAKGRFDPGRDGDRITPIGRWLRKTKLDELPQFWNVLRGEMSLVGPRPEVPRWTEVYPERWEVVLSVRPGITDPASIEYRHEEALLAAAEDLAVLLRTATSIFRRDAGPATLGDPTAFR